jgi:DNA-binding transcriptional MerR regulator
MNEGGWRIGALAAASGLTVRTLHYYDEIGLLSPSQRSGAGHRVYADADVQRLYRICTLRRLGLPLAQVAKALDDDEWSLAAALGAQLEDLDGRLEAQCRLRARLAQLLPPDRQHHEPSTAELLDVLEEMTMLDTGVQRRISILVCADLEAEYDYLIRCFGLAPSELNHDDDGVVVHAELQAGDGVVWLHPERSTFNLVSPRTLAGSTAMVAVLVDDVDAHHRHAVENGAQIRYEPVDQPYGYREYGAYDCEGHLWSFMRPLA